MSRSKSNKVTLNAKVVAAIRPAGKPFEVTDTTQPGLVLRVQPSGVKSFVCRYGRNKRVTVGRPPGVTVAMARTRAKKVIAHGGPLPEDEGPGLTLGEFIEDHYRAHVLAHNKTGEATLARLEACFGDFFDRPMTDITTGVIEIWRAKRKREGRKPGTINRDVTALYAALSRAVDWDHLDAHPLKKLKPLKVDKMPTVRYLTAEEEARLRRALDDRERRLREGRASGNRWRSERDYKPMPEITGAFADNVKPLVLLSLNTGLRRGEAFGLTWADIDLTRRSLTVRGHGAKTGQTRHIPLNREAYETLRGWKAQQDDASGLVFKSARTGRGLNNTRKSWLSVLAAADVEAFRWHDMRHHFASRLVMSGVDIYRIAELLGHSSIEVTKRYAHLAPENLAAAVAVLDK